MANGAVTAGHFNTAEAAASILREGGNAFDAAVAGLFAASIVEPALSSLGGGGFMMTCPRNEKPILFDFFVHSPANRKDINDVDVHSFICDFGSAQQEFWFGPGTCAVPGYVKGIFEVASRYASMSMRDLIQPALDILRNGIPVNEMQAHIFEILAPIYSLESTNHVYTSKQIKHKMIQQGEVLQLPQYSDLLESLAIEGDDLFYRGEIAKGIDELGQNGSFLTYEDMANYEVKLRTPMKVEYKNFTTLLNPPPSNGGVLMALMLTRLSQLGLSQYDFGSSSHLKELIETMKAASELGNTTPEQNTNFDSSLVQLFRHNLNEHYQCTRGTTHISIIDRHQNTVSVSVSNGEGCGTFVPGTSIMMNNMLGELDVNPCGLQNWPPNVRLGSSMAPTVAAARDGSLIATGSGGSNRIPFVVLQVLSNIVDFGMSVEQAVRAPRLHFHESVAYAEDVCDKFNVAAALESFENTSRFNQRNIFFGGVHTVRYSNNSIEGFGDNRRNGVAIVI